MPFPSPHQDVEIQNTPVHVAVLSEAGARGAHPALVDGLSGQTISYMALEDMTRRLAGGLAAIGLRPGDVLGLFSPNTILYPVVFHAAVRAGATVTTINALATP